MVLNWEKKNRSQISEITGHEQRGPPLSSFWRGRFYAASGALFNAALSAHCVPRQPPEGSKSIRPRPGQAFLRGHPHQRKFESNTFHRPLLVASGEKGLRQKGRGGGGGSDDVSGYGVLGWLCPLENWKAAAEVDTMSAGSANYKPLSGGATSNMKGRGLISNMQHLYG